MDVAQLGISVDSSSAVKAAADLDAFTASAGRAAGAGDTLAKSAATVTSAQQQIATSAAESTSAVTTAGDRMLASVEKQIVLFGASSQAVAHYNGVMAGMVTTELEWYKAQLLTLEGMKAQAAAEEARATASEAAYSRRMAAAVAAQRERNAAAAEAQRVQDAQIATQDKFLASLQTQIDTMGLSTSQLLAYKAAQLGVTEQAAPLIAAIEAQAAALSNSGKAAAGLGESEAAATERIRAMTAASLEQVAALNGSTAAAQRYAASVAEVAATETARAAGGVAAVGGVAAASTGGRAAAGSAYAQSVNAAARAEADAAQTASVANKVLAASHEEVAVAAGRSAVGTSTATRELITMGREISRGDVTRLAGSFTIFAQATGLVEKALTPVGMVITAFGGAALVASIAADKAAKNLEAVGASVTRVAEQTGASTDFIQKFNFAIESVGGKAADGGTALDHLAIQVGRAEEGSKRAQGSFAALGISMNDLKTLSLDQIVYKIANAFQNAGDDAGKYTVAQQLLGNSSKELIQVLNSGSDGLAAFGDQAQKVGGVLSESTIAQMNELSRRSAEAHAAWSAMVTTAETALIPTLLTLTGAMSGTGGAADAMKGFFLGVNEVLKGTAVVVATVGTGFNQMAELIATGAVALNLVRKGEIEAGNAAIINGWNHVKEEGQSYINFVKNLYKETAPPAPTTVIGAGTITPPVTGGTRADAGAVAQARQPAVDLKTQFDAQQKLLQDQRTVLTDDHKAQIVSDQDFYDKENQLNDQDLVNKLSYYTKLEAITRAHMGLSTTSAAQRVKDQETINQAQSSSNVAIGAYAAQSTAISDQVVAAHNKQTDAVQKYTDAQQQRLLKQQEVDAQSLESAGIKKAKPDLATMLGEQQVTAVAGIQAEVGQGRLTQAAADQEIAVRKNTDAQIIANHKAATDQMAIADKSWSVGASNAWDAWQKQAGNTSQQVSAATTNLLNGLTDQLVRFAETGKISFQGLAASFIGALAKMEVQAAESQVFKLIGQTISPGGAAGLGLGPGLLGGLLQTLGMGATSGAAGGFGIMSGGVGGAVSGALGTTTAGLASTFGVGASTAGAFGVSAPLFTMPIAAATGGHVTGPGTSTSDSIPARLSNGEFVVNAAATSANLPMLHALNGGSGSAGRTHFANGGFVGPQPNVSGGSTAITFNIGNGTSGAVAPGASAASQVRSAAMQKELTASVIEIVRRHSLPGGQINQIIKTAAAR